MLLFLSYDLAVITESMAFAPIPDRFSVIVNVLYVTCWSTGVLEARRVGYYPDRLSDMRHASEDHEEVPPEQLPLRPGDSGN